VEGPRQDLGREAERLATPHPSIGVPVPAFEGRSLPNVTASVLRATGAELAEGPPIAPALASDLDPFAGRRAEGPVVVLLVDGFGWHALTAWARGGRSAGAARWTERARPITTVFSTTTTAALPSLSTAAPPGRTGMVGYRQYLPAFGHVVDLLKMSPIGVATPEALIGPAWTPSHICGVPNIFSRGARGAVLGRASFRGTGFTRLLYDGAEFVPYASEADFAELLARTLARPSPPPIVFAYWDGLDTIQHLWGPDPELLGLELDLLGRALAHVRGRLDPGLARRTTFLVTGDHGQVPFDESAEFAVDREPTILPLLARPPAGDRRAGFFSARPGKRDALEAALASRLPAGSRVVRSEAALAAGLFGPPPHHPELLERVGELLAFVPRPAGITYLSPGVKPPERFRPGAHGGLDADELIVPLVTGSLHDLG
jgi:hypothetical protein